jgi:hypothetical protein
MTEPKALFGDADAIIVIANASTGPVQDLSCISPSARRTGFPFVEAQ